MEPVVTVLIPSRNGGDGLYTRLRALAEKLQKPAVRFLLVDDGSTDGTWSAMCAFARDAEFPVVCLRLSGNRGQQSALLAGLSRSVTEYVVTMDDDSEHPVGLVYPLLKTAEKGFQLVYARNRHRRPGLRSTVRRGFSRLHSWNFRLFMGCPPGISVGSFRILRRDLIDAILAEPTRFVYISAKAFRFRPRTGMIEYKCDVKKSSASRYDLRTLFKLEFNLFRFYGPLRRRLENDDGPVINCGAWVAERYDNKEMM